MKAEYYTFVVFSPYVYGGEKHKTLWKAKQSYLKHLKQGHRLGSDILGCTKQNDCIFLSYTPFNSDTKTFGRTQLTYMGEKYRNSKTIEDYETDNKED